jgi:hypothetical protein
MAWYDDIANTTKNNVTALANALMHPVDTATAIGKNSLPYKYRNELASALRGGTKPLDNALNEWAKTITPQDAANLGLGFAGSIKGVGKFPLTSIEEKILNQGGNYALQRFQKAKSLAPDLEKQYTEEALIPLFTAKTERNALTVMKPSEFQNFASPLSEEYTSSPQFASKIENLQNIANTTGFNEIPHLHLNKYDHEPVITNHEGRHRTTAFTANGDNPTLVEIMPRYSMYEKVNPDFNMNQKQFIKALNQEMSLNSNVKPQPEFVNDVEKSRQPIKFPNELFGLGAIPFVDYNNKK